MLNYLLTLARQQLQPGVKRGLHAVAVMLLMTLGGWSGSAQAVKCVQSGYLPEEGAIECVASTIVNDVYYSGSVGWGAAINCPTSFTETELMTCASAQIRQSQGGASKCFVKQELVRDWFIYPLNPFGSGWTNGPAKAGGSYSKRLFGKSFRTSFSAVSIDAVGQYVCDFSKPGLTINWEIVRKQEALCPFGSSYLFLHLLAEGGDGSFVCGSPTRLQCPRPGNPIDLATGAKLLTEAHVALDSSTGLQLTWHYNSRRQAFVGLKPGVSASTKPVLGYADRVWRHTYERVLIHDTTGTRPVVHIIRPETNDAYFANINGVWKRSQYVRSDSLVQNLSSTTARWEYRDEDDTREIYNSAGRLTKIVEPNGQQLSLTYNTAGLLDRVTHTSGRYIRFEYSTDGLLTAAVTPSGDRTTYAFDPNFKTLQSVTFPGGAVKRYLYEGTYKHLLTGITDELGQRFATYSYDATQRPISTQHAGGVERYTVNYGQTWAAGYDPPMSVTGPTGTSAIANWRSVGTAIVYGYNVLPAEALAGFSAALPGLESWGKTSENDANGNITMREHFDGKRTRASFDLSRNLETRRIENADTTAAQTSNTQYHPDWALPTKSSSANQRTTVIYHGQVFNGQSISCAPSTVTLSGKPLPLACWVIEQPTSDNNGSQGFAAAASGNATVTRATYNAAGQPLLIERYDNVTPTAAQTPTALPSTKQPSQRRTATYATATATDYSVYKGDLLTLTLAWPNQSPVPAPQTTTFRKYNKRGQVLEFQGPDGSVTTLTYHARGWLTKHSYLPVTGNLQVTSYSYDAAGQLKKATLPDLSSVSFTYDTAHRLRSIADSKGNAVTYTFNAASQITAVTPTGNLYSLGTALRTASLAQFNQTLLAFVPVSQSWLTQLMDILIKPAIAQVVVPIPGPIPIPGVQDPSTAASRDLARRLGRLLSNSNVNEGSNTCSTRCDGEIVYRLYGGRSFKWGKYWSPINPLSVTNYRFSAGLPSENSGEYLVTGCLWNYEGVSVTLGGAAAIGENKGGIIEYVVPEPLKKIRELSDVKLPKPL